MPEHTWVIETIDGGPVGDADIWRCSVCGCCGGDDARPPRPFFPGPAIDLSDDCAVAHEQISYFVRGHMRAWELSSIRKKDVKERELLRLLDAADRFTPRARSRVEFNDILRDCYDPVSREKLTVIEVMERLVSIGFKLESVPCVECGKPSECAADAAEKTCMACWWGTYKKNHKGWWAS